MEYVKLGDICSKIGSGSTPSGGKEAYQGGGYKLIRSQNVHDLAFCWDGLAEINEVQAIKLKNVTVEANDVLLNITGDSVARSCIVPSEILPARVNQHVAIIRPNPNILDSYYLLSYLQVNQQYLLALASTGATRNALTKRMIEKLTIPLMPLPAQRKIASILSSYDSLIENNTKRIRLLEQMAENLYKEWFVRFRFPGHENTEFVDGLPKGWAIKKIKDCYNTCSGGTPNREKAEYYINGNIPWIKTGEIQDSIILDTEEKITSDALKHSSAKLLPQNSLLMAMYGVNIGKLGILTKQMSCNQAACAFLPNEENNTFYYLFFYLKSIREYLLNIGFGAAQQNLSQTLIKNIRIILPSKDIINCFEQKINRLYKQIEILQRQSALLTRQRDLLLPRLMSGKLEVKS